MPTKKLRYGAGLLQVARLGVLLCGLAAGGAQANLIPNPGFEAGLSGWTTMGTAQRTLVKDPSGNALSVSQRASVSDGMFQDIEAGLAAADNGPSYVSRVTIKLAQPASVRLYLNVSDSSGSSKLLLAEQVVRVGNQPVVVQGVNPIVWHGSLTRARLYLEVGQLAEGVFPDYTLDDLLVERDGDADGLSDNEEAALGTNPALADTDGDGMRDGWEVANGLNPLVDDAGLDPDADGYTNLQEYWAATDPRDASLYPGKPSNPKLDARARATLKYLALLPSQSTNRVIAGQHVSDAASTDIQGYGYSVTALEQETGKNLGIVEFQYEGTTPAIQYQIAAVNLLAESAWKQGKLVEIKWNPFIPWNNKSFNDSASFGQVDIAGMLAQNSAANQQAMATFNGYLDTVAAGLDQLQQKKVVVLWRFMSEMNGSWFWWGHRPQADYVALWRYIYDYLTNTKQLNNLIWVYESDAGVHGLMPSDYYFPGADVVDVVGHNFYSDTWQMAYDLDTLYRQYGKVYAFPQAGSASKSPVRTTRSGWDNLTIINGIKARHPRASYFCVWNSFISGLGAQYIAIVDQQNAAALLNDPWVVTADEIALEIHSVSGPVVEFYNSNLDHYFITANAGEASAIDGGSAGPGWSRTGYTFASGGSSAVCRFYGSQSPGPNSHFYTVDAGECASLKQIQASTPATEKRWNFESLDFLSTPAVNGMCPGATVPVYRAYNNGYALGVDSNHRITGNLAALQEVVGRGWINEGVVMCAPMDATNTGTPSGPA